MNGLPDGGRFDVPLPIARVQTNVVSLGGFCADGSVLTAEVTGPAMLALRPSSCPIPSSSCSSLTETYRSGTGTLADGFLVLVVDGSTSGCGQEDSNQLRYTGDRGLTTPEIDSLSPAGAVVGDPGFTLVVRGRGFVARDRLYFGSVFLPTVVVSAQELRGTVSDQLLTEPGMVQVGALHLSGHPSDPKEFTVSSP